MNDTRTARAAQKKIHELASKFIFETDYNYDDESVAARVADRVAFVLGHVGNHGLDYLEFGCGPENMTKRLNEMGKRAASIDIDGVGKGRGDITKTRFKPSSFDVIYSFNAMEHVMAPKKAMNEMWRILRPGGQIFLHFGPLYNSMYGAHAYRSVPIPFIQHLFTNEEIAVYTIVKDLPMPDFDTNGWSLAQWRGLFKDGRFEIMTYEEQRKDAQIIYDERLAEDMPTIRKVVPSDDELQVSAILVRLVKK